MRAEHDGVAGLERNQRVVDGCGGRVGRGNHRRHYADRTRHFDDALFPILADHADRAHAGHGPRHVHRRQPVLRRLVGDIAEACLFHGAARQGFGGSGASGGATLHDGVNLLLGKCRELLLSGGSACDEVAGFLDGNEIAVAQIQGASPPYFLAILAIS